MWPFLHHWTLGPMKENTHGAAMDMCTFIHIKTTNSRIIHDSFKEMLMSISTWHITSILHVIETFWSFYIRVIIGRPLAAFDANNRSFINVILRLGHKVIQVWIPTHCRRFRSASNYRNQTKIKKKLQVGLLHFFMQFGVGTTESGWLNN